MKKNAYKCKLKLITLTRRVGAVFAYKSKKTLSKNRAKRVLASNGLGIVNKAADYEE